MALPTCASTTLSTALPHDEFKTLPRFTCCFGFSCLINNNLAATFSPLLELLENTESIRCILTITIYQLLHSAHHLH
jgi:hypothetical protein